MIRYSRFVCAVFAAFVLSYSLPGQVVRRLSALPAEDAARVALPNSVAGHAARAERVGPLPETTALTGLSLVLKPSAAQDADLKQLLADQQDPSKPAYHQWLTPQQFGDRFGLADADLAVLRSWLEAHGLQVDEVPASRNLVRFSGTAADVAQAFRTSFHQYRNATQSFHENDGPVQLPAALADVVEGVGGLSSYRIAGQHVRMATPGTVSADGTGKAAPQFTTTGTKGTVHYLVPWDFRQIYGINTLINSGFDGSGIKIGVIGQSAVDTQQLTYFQNKTGQPAKLPAMVLVPNSGVTNRVAGDEDESELDLEYSTGSAPGAAVQFIYTGCTAAASTSQLAATTDCGNDGIFTALGYAITSNVAPILTLSYGGCESSLASYATSTLEPLLQQANAQGQTVLVASGDAGAAACDQGSYVTVATQGLTVQYPASSTYVTAVGGTQLNSDNPSDWSATNNGALGSAAGYIQETTWNDITTVHVLEASGGGVSKTYPMPIWQKPFVQPNANFRMVPDVSFAASEAFHPYMVCVGDVPCTSGTGGFTPGTDGVGFGGTSVAAPNFAAMLAVIEQANGGGALGNIDPALYTLAVGSQYATAFHDITSGDNMVPCKEGTTNCQTGSMGYTAVAGYDMATGLGSVSAAGLQTALKSLPARSVTVSMRAIPQRIDLGAPQLGTVFNVELDALSTTSVVPTGTVVVKVDGVAQAQTQTLYGGSVLLPIVLNALGQHTITATYSGDKNFDGANGSISVTPIPAVPQIIVTVLNHTAAVNTPVPLLIGVVTGTLPRTKDVLLTIDGNSGSQIDVANSADTGYSYTYPGFATAGVHTLVATYPGDALVSAASGSATVTISTSNTLQSATVTATATPQTVTAGSLVTLSANVKSTFGGSTTPTGYVTFNVDGVALPTVPVNASGTAQTTYTETSTGTSTVAANYSGDNVYGSAFIITYVYLQAPPAPTISLALANTSVTIPSTGVAAVGLNLSSVNGFSGPVSISSSIVSSSGAAFSGCYGVSPGVLFPTPGNPGTGTFSIALASNSFCAKASILHVADVASSGERPGQRTAPWTASLAGAIFAFAMLRRRTPRGLLAALVLACAMAATGCGGGSGGSSGSTTTTTTPPPVTTSPTSGTYQVKVTATAETTGVSSSSTFTLTVQ